MLGQTQFVGSEFGWICSLVLEDEPGFGKVRSSVFPDLGLGSAHFWLNKFEVRAFWKGEGFKRVRSTVLVDKPRFE